MVSRSAFAVVHCTAGDVVIGASALIAALIVTRSGPLEGWRWFRLGLIATVFGLAYTGFSEWANTAIKSSFYLAKRARTSGAGASRVL